MVTSYTSFGTQKNTALGDWQWKIVTHIQAAIPLVCCVGILLCPESPRWLVQKGKDDKARRALARVREEHEIDAEIEEVRDGGFSISYLVD